MLTFGFMAQGSNGNFFFVTSTTEGERRLCFHPVLSVCLCSGYLKKLCTDSDETWWTRWVCGKDELVRSWWRSESASGYENYLIPKVILHHWEIGPKTIYCRAGDLRGGGMCSTEFPSILIKSLVGFSGVWTTNLPDSKEMLSPLCHQVWLVIKTLPKCIFSLYCQHINYVKQGICHGFNQDRTYHFYGDLIK